MIKINDFSIDKISSGYMVSCKSFPFVVMSTLKRALFVVIYCSSRADL